MEGGKGVEDEAPRKFSESNFIFGKHPL